MLKQLINSPLLRSSAIYTLSTMVSAAVPFLLMPVLTRYLTRTDYGIVSMVALLVGLASPFIGLNLHGAISVRYFDASTGDIPRYIGNCLILALIGTASISCLLWLFGEPISALTAVPRGWLAAIVPIAAGQFIVLVLLALWQAQGKAVHYSVLQLMQTALNISLTLVLVVSLHQKWQGRIVAQVASVLICAVIAVVVLMKSGWIRFDRDNSDMRHALRFGIPLIPHTIGAIVITQTDRIFITNMVSVADTGLYAVGFQIAIVIELFAGSFNRAYVPWLFKRLSENDPVEKRRIVKLTYLYFGGMLLFAAALSLMTPWFLPILVGKEFAGAGRFTPWLALGFAFNGMYYMVTNYIFFAQATHILARVTFLAAVVNIICNYVLITINGVVGAAQASALALFVSFALTWILSAKVYPMPWNLSRTVR